MQFSPITPSSNALGSAFDLVSERVRQRGGPSIGDRVESALSQVNDMQLSADKQASKLALGDVRSLHSVMMASEEAGLALSTVLQVRNKAVEAYQEIMRMQV